MYFLRINFRALGVPGPEPAPGAKPWELYARCNEKRSDSCDLFQQIARLVPKDQKAAVSALYKLIQVAASGQPITNYYDKKQCHDIHAFNYLGKERTVWRIWKGDVVRVTFYYGEGRTILLANAFSKYEDKLSQSQKAMLEKEVIAYIDAVNAKKLYTFEKTDEELS